VKAVSQLILVKEMINKLTRRVISRIFREFKRHGFFLSVRFFDKVSDSNFVGQKKLLIVAPGEIEIPPVGWGAVETIISETLGIYVDAGFEVWLLNSKHPKEWKKAANESFDLVLNHSDIDSARVASCWPGIKQVVISHYGLAAYPERWHREYKNIIRKMDQADYVVCLSKEIYEVYKTFFDVDKLFISSNGSSFDPIVRKTLQSNILCIGKVEVRKRQFELWQELHDSSVKLIFAGPIVDERVISRLKAFPELKEIFVGPMSRVDLAQQLQNFRAIILPSNGEADALVLYEAQLAGLEVLVTLSGKGAQDSDLEWIHIISENPTEEEIKLILSSSKSDPREISEYARKNYRWSTRNKELVVLLTKISSSELEV